MFQIMHPITNLLFCKDKSTRKQEIRFGIAKAAVLQRKRAAFTVQNLRFWNAKQ